MRNTLRWLILLLLCALYACSRQDPVPVEPVLQDGVWTGTGENTDGSTYNLQAKAVVIATGGFGANLVNHAGERFVNEVDTRDVVSAAILAQ